MALFVTTSAGVVCTVRVTPRAGRTAAAGIRDDVLLVRLAAAPVDGAANAALVGLLSRIFDVPKRDIRIISGETSRLKRILAAGLSADQAAERLNEHLGGRPGATGLSS